MKKILIYSGALILIISIIVIILVNNKDTNTLKLNNNKLLSIDVESIVSVRMREATEGGYFYYKTEDKSVIYDIYNALNNIKIGRKADINVVDDSRDYIFDINDGTEKIYSFHSNFYYFDYTTYETENYKVLKRIEIPKIEKFRFDNKVN